jgi:hypothetical protein
VVPGREDPASSKPTTRGLTLGEYVQRLNPQMHLVSVSQPDPRLARHNVLAVTGDVEAARKAVLELEALEADDAKLGLAVLSRSGEADVVDGRVDPEGVTRMVGSRILVGGALGVLVGALLIGGMAALFASDSALVLAIAGAVLGGVFGATGVVFAGMGGSDAYRQSFIAPEVTQLCVVSLHTDDVERAGEGRSRMGAREWNTMIDVDANGLTTKGVTPDLVGRHLGR